MKNNKCRSKLCKFAWKNNDTCIRPCFIVEKIACSRIDVVVPIDEVIEQTITGVKGIGGSETRGKFRWAMPKQYYTSKN